MAVTALIQALPLVREAVCHPGGRRAVRKAVDFTCGPPAGTLMARGAQAFLRHGGVGGPLVPLACKMGGTKVVEPLVDAVCNTPPDELEAQIRRVADRAQTATAVARTVRGKPARISIDGFWG